MALAAGSRLGNYEILALIGKGGMGEVYRARDPRLDRDVAIKVLPPALAEHRDRLARFEREAKVLAALNHPNIATIHGLEDRAIVMELVEGPTLADRIRAGSIPFAESMKIALQIAEALDAAHERGVVHRDLKPANIKVRDDGTVKVLDFGLATAVQSSAREGVDGSESPTLTVAATEAGIILGTAAYMAPEQARGQKADKRADIWAFGVVLYEMLTGERLFQGDTVSDVLARVLTEEPDLDRAPANARKVLRRCLNKDPKLRLRDIGDARFLVEEEPPGSSGASKHQKSRWLWPSIAAVLLLALSAAVAWILKPAPPPNITRFPVSLGQGQVFTNTGRPYLGISPDGTQMVYVANSRLYVRSMAELEARVIPGSEMTDGVTNPVFSPDGRSLAFYANGDGTLKRIAVSGGAAVTICRVVVTPVGIHWSEAGIVFPELGKGILRVSPNGGQPEPLVIAKSNEVIEEPQMLPGGQAILFTSGTGTSMNGIVWDRAEIVVQTLKSGERKTVVAGGTGARYLPTGHLVYSVGGVLFAVPFNLQRLETTGGPVAIVEGVARTGEGSVQFAFSNTGSLIYVPGPVTAAGGQEALVLVDLKGNIEPLKLPFASYGFPRVSPGGKRVAYQVDEIKESGIWIFELSGKTAPRRLTLPGTGANRYPVWFKPNSPGDAERVAFQSDREGDLGVFWQSADGNGPAERLTRPDEGASHIPDSWSPDGKTFSFTEEKRGKSSVWIYSLRDKKATLLSEGSKPYLGRSVFSPDGRWLAYQDSNVQENQIYVEPFPPNGTKYEVPRDGTSHHPAWSPDGKRLFFVAGNGAFDSVSVTIQPSLTFGIPERAPKAGFRTLQASSIRNYDVLPDGRHFIGTLFAGQAQGVSGTASPSPQIQVVLNWFEDVKQRAPGTAGR